MNKKTLEQLAVRTGLSVKACMDMLNGGWIYVEDACGYRWEPPRAFKKFF